MERRHVYGVLIGVVGLVLAWIQTLHGLRQSDRPIVFIFEAGPFVLVGLSVLYAGYWLARNEPYEPDLPRVLAWTGGSTLLFASVSALMLFSQRVTLGTLDRATVIAVDLITIGVVVGVVVGLYDARSQQRRRTLERQRDRIEAFANKAADVNNYGRALNRSTSDDEVSGLCIEALQVLLDLPETAIVALRDGRIDTIDNTIIGVETSDLQPLAETAREQDRAAVALREEVSTPLDERGDRVLSILLTDRSDLAIVALSPVPDGTAFDDEDLQLVEFLASHAGTALEGIRDENATPESTPS